MREHHGLAAASKQAVRRSLQDKWERTRTQASSWDKELNGECLIAGCRHRCRETHLLLRRTPLNLFGRSHVSWCALAAAAVATDLVLLRSTDATRGEPGREREEIYLSHSLYHSDSMEHYMYRHRADLDFTLNRRKRVARTHRLHTVCSPVTLPRRPVILVPFHSATEPPKSTVTYRPAQLIVTYY